MRVNTLMITKLALIAAEFTIIIIGPTIKFEWWSVKS